MTIEYPDPVRMILRKRAVAVFRCADCRDKKEYYGKRSYLMHRRVSHGDNPSSNLAQNRKKQKEPRVPNEEIIVAEVIPEEIIVAEVIPEEEVIIAEVIPEEEVIVAEIIG